VELPQQYIRDFDITILKHFWRSFCDAARMNLHIELKFGEDLHHCMEAVFKAVARALRMACDTDPRALDLIPSSKGRIGA
jgi:imidazoleglycerol-phosphate dehydratase